MGVARKWVFPIIRMVLVAVVAAALVKLAFFPDGSASADPAQPTGQITEPHVAVTTGTITNNVTLKGTVTADAAVPVRATGHGVVDEVFAKQGQTVAAGDVLFDIKVETPRDPVESTAPDGSITVTQPKPLVRFEKVLAPTAGILSSFTVLPGQNVAVGEAAGQVAPPTFSVTGSLSPEQQYRLLNQPTEASVSIPGGPGEFTCTGLSITTPLAGATPGDGGAAPDGGSGTSTTVRCAVPSDIKVFAGLAADITIAGGKAENVLVVPTTAVKGTAQTGVVWLVGSGSATGGPATGGAAPDAPATGGPATDAPAADVPVTVAPENTGPAEGRTPVVEPTKKTVKLGLTDGSMVQIVEGLAEGDEILEFVPGAPAHSPQGENCVRMPDGGMMCSGFGG